MKFKLVTLESYITRQLPRHRPAPDQDWQTWLQEQQSQVDGMISRTRLAILEDLLRIGRRSKRRNYARLHADALVGISAKLRQLHAAAVKTPPDIRRHLAPFYFRIAEAVAGLILLIKNTAPAHFDQTLPVPFTQLAGYRRRFSDLGRSLLSLKTRLDEHTAPVIDLVLQKVQKAIGASDGLSYERGQYFLDLLQTLAAIREIPSVNINMQLHVGLITYNFNSPDYISYCNMKLVEKYDTSPAEKKLEVLLWYHLRLQQVVPLERYSLFAGVPTAQYQLHQWVYQEVLGLQQQLPALAEPSAIVRKLHTTLSVAQIATLADVAMQMGILNFTTKMEVYRAISACLTSKNSEQISIVSLAAKANNESPVTIGTLIDLTLKALAELRRRQ